MTTQAVGLGFCMAFMADRAGDIAQMGLVGITVFEIFRLCFFGQLVHGTMTGQAAAVFHRIIGFGKIFPVTLGTNDPSPGMEIVRII